MPSVLNSTLEVNQSTKGENLALQFKSGENRVVRTHSKAAVILINLGTLLQQVRKGIQELQW